ncbi:MAG: hypothetical protein L0271_06880, partial [Gemmatimonadetes bacterium]|nr:hypothetical protein [Gemmatimonadota bacterium]
MNTDAPGREPAATERGGNALKLAGLILFSLVILAAAVYVPELLRSRHPEQTTSPPAPAEDAAPLTQPQDHEPAADHAHPTPPPDEYEAILARGIPAVERVKDGLSAELPREYVQLEPWGWVGLRIEALEWVHWLPDDSVQRMTQGTRLVVMYLSFTDASHRVFDEFLAGVTGVPITAVRVPRSERSGPIPLPDLGPVTCPGCEFVALPRGPLWILAPLPRLLRVEDGVVTCVAAGDDELEFETCI